MSHQTAKQVARYSAHHLVDLPRSPDRWYFAESSMDQQQLHQLWRYGIIERIKPDDEREPNEWRTKPTFYDYAEDYLANRESLPCCGATGVSNVGGDLHCKDCGEPISEEAFRRVTA